MIERDRDDELDAVAAGTEQQIVAAVRRRRIAIDGNIARGVEGLDVDAADAGLDTAVVGTVAVNVAKDRPGDVGDSRGRQRPYDTKKERRSSEISHIQPPQKK